MANAKISQQAQVKTAKSEMKLENVQSNFVEETVELDGIAGKYVEKIIQGTPKVHTEVINTVTIT